MATFYMNHESELYHYGILGMHWGIRRYQNKDGTLTEAGKKRYGSVGKSMSPEQREAYREAKSLIENEKHETETARRLWERYDKKRQKLNAKYTDKTIDVNGKKFALMKEKESAALSDYERNAAFYDDLYKKSAEKLNSIFNESREKYGEKRIKDIKTKDMKYGKKILGSLFDKELIGTSVAAMSVSAVTAALTVAAFKAGVFVYAPYMQGGAVALGALGALGLLSSTTPLANKESRDRYKYGFDTHAYRDSYKAKNKGGY